ncbi:hypothetical protein D1BOALGB6SA_10427 [Olavius sp. associated proteobacterium Delta 1]|nr:hypothetical protein D1BOALGB6SA_10427 [Olavius sp. associated proteobacterium Delta 1]
MGIIRKFISISPENSRYLEKILAYWNIEKKFAFFRPQYDTERHICIGIN